MLNNNYDINQHINNKGQTHLMKIAKGKFGIDILKYLITNNANINIQDNKGYTALMIATKYNKIDIVNYLLTHNADLNLQNNDGDTALLIASKYLSCLSKEIIKTLINHNADINKQNYNGWTALMYIAINSDKYSEYNIFKLLLQNGSDMYLKNNQNLTVFQLVEIYNNVYNTCNTLNTTCSTYALIILHNEICRRKTLTECKISKIVLDKLLCPRCNNTMNDPIIMSTGESCCRNCVYESDDELIPNVTLNDIIMSINF